MLVAAILAMSHYLVAEKKSMLQRSILHVDTKAILLGTPVQLYVNTNI